MKQRIHPTVWSSPEGNDSYGTIAQRYDVKEDALRLANNNKEVNERTLVILPSV